MSANEDLEKRRVELNAKLAELRRLKQQRGDADAEAVVPVPTVDVPATAQPAPAPKPQYPAPICSYGYAEKGCKGYDDDDEHYLDDEDEFCDEAFGDAAEDAWLEEQERDTEEAHEVASAMSAAFAASAKSVDDFKTDMVLRLIKFGNVNELKRMEAILGNDAFKKLIVACKDNSNRTALHYAADSASVEMVRFLMTEAVLQSFPSETGLTPMHVAVLRCAPAVVKHLAAAETGEVTIPTFEDTLKKFAPKPPSLIVTKALMPVAPDTRRARKFWKLPVASECAARALELNDTDFKHEQASRLIAERWYDNFGGNGVASPWTNPPSAQYFQQWSLRFHHIVCHTTAENLVGYMAIVPVGHLVVKGKVVEKPAYSAQYLVAKADVEGMASQILMGAANYLKGCACVFRVPMSTTKTFPLPFTPLTMLKWFRRCVHPQLVLHDRTLLDRDPMKLDCFAEAASYDFMLCADVVVKEALVESTETAADPLVTAPWYDLADLGPEACDAAAALCSACASAEFAEVSVAWTADAIRHMFVNPSTAEDKARPPDDLVALVRYDATKVTDMIVFRRYTCAELTADGHTSRRQMAAVVVCACFFGSLKKTNSQRLKSICAVAKSQLHAQEVYMCTSFGVSESELRQAFFSEVVGRHEALYAVADSNGAPITGVVPAVKVGIPFFY